MSNPIIDGIDMAMKDKPAKDKSVSILLKLALTFFLVGWGFTMKDLHDVQRKYDVLVEVAIAKHDEQLVMEALMNNKSSDSTSEVNEAIDIVYLGKKPVKEK